MRHPSGRMLVSVTGESNDNNPSWSKILFESDGMTEAEKPQSDIGRVRRGGRGARREIRSAHDFTMLPALKRKIPLTEPMDQEQVEKIDKASLDILEEVGVVFRDDIAIEDWKKAGADVRADDRVHFDRDMIKELISSIPETFTYHARDPKKVKPHAASDAFICTSYCRADGSRDFTSSFAHYLFLHEAFGQDVYGHDDQPKECRRCHGHVRHTFWRRLS